MTVADNYEPVIYTGNGVTTSFPFAFSVGDADELVVISRVIATDVDTVVPAANYTVVGTFPGAGSVTYQPGGSPLASTHKLIIARSTELVQGMDITSGGGFFPTVLEEQLDVIERQVQELKENIDRAFQLKVKSAVADFVLEPQADTYLGWNSGADGLENKVVVGLSGETLPATPSVFLRRNAGGTAYEALTAADTWTAVAATNPFNQTLTGGHWSDTGTTPRLHFQNDRVFIGLAAGDIWTGYNFTPGVTPLSWIGGITEDLRYLEKGAQLAVFSKVGGPASLFASRRSDHDGTATGPYTAAVGALVYNNVAGPVGVQTTLTHPGTWASYKEAYRIQAAGVAIALELEAINLGAETTFSTPYGPRDAAGGNNLRTASHGLGIGAGGGNTNLTLHPSTSAIYITNNGTTFRSGIVFLNGALTDRGTNQFRAIEFGRYHRVVWATSTGENAKSLEIYSSHLDATKRSIIEAAATSFRIKTIREDLTTETSHGLAINWPALTGAQDINGVVIIPSASGASGACVIQASGTDAVFGLAIRPKGAAAVSLQDQSGNNRIAVSAPGIGVFGTTPVTMTGWATATGTATRTTFDTTTVTTAQLAERVKALIDDFHQTAGYGWLRT